MTLADLKSFEKGVRYRTGMAGESDVEWGPWKDGEFFITRRTRDLPTNLRQRCSFWRKGDITAITPIGEGADWATYTQGDYQGNGLFVNEGYYLEIEGLV